ncbi:MAG: (d)CMP kinase [Planctomycetales bacterium]|nr:(d)CMP kinase [Planctomycetales bacterium]
MIVAIDGPAGAGKSTVARRLAERLGFRYLDTGAMYRAVALAALRAGATGDDPASVLRVAEAADIIVDGQRVLLNGEDVAEAIRSPEVTAVIHWAADNPSVRARLVELQRTSAAADGGIVCEGRDQGTVAFPDAGCKFFVTASPEERARRRRDELHARGVDVSLDDVLADQNERDRRDAARPVGALRKANDAVEIMTDGLSVDAVVDKLEQMVRDRLSGR